MDSQTKKAVTPNKAHKDQMFEAPETPVDEAARLCALHAIGILDSATDERFDRLTRMATRLLNVPISIVSLVDQERQWFKSRCGLEAEETPRDISFCGHAILGDQIFVVEDASKDERFKHNPLVTGAPHIRFYAGRPLSAGDGSKLGTLCVIDQKPRTPTAEELESLHDLAAMVEREIGAVYQASVDDLTKIANRRGFDFLARHIINICDRENMPMTLAYFDLSDFKRINDKFGHAEGDLALKAFVNTTKKTLRASDIFARIGGDEFVVLMSGATPDIARNFVARTHSHIADYNRRASRGYNIRFAEGIIEYNVDRHSSLDQLLADGDALMYRHKIRNKLVKLPPPSQ